MYYSSIQGAVERGADRHRPVSQSGRVESDNRSAMASLNPFKLICFFLLGAMAAWANVCTPLNAPANGPFGAVVNGIDALDWGVARVQWRSDATSATPATQVRIQFASAAQWAANPGVYPQTHAGDSYNPVADSVTVQGDILTNLLPNTSYHVLGQSLQGGAWCAATDEVITTTARPASPLPQQPQTFSTTRPAITGTDWTYGSTCGTSGGVQAQLSDCFTKAQPGDGIGIPPGTYLTSPFVAPRNPNAVLITCTTTGSTCTQSGTAPPNGTQIRMGAFEALIPSPINSGVTYKVMNASGSTFQISYDGITPITLLNAGTGNVYYVVWPLTQGYVVVHSTASAALLPPDGVRLGPNTLAQYLPQMPEIVNTEINQAIIFFPEMTSYYWFQNIAFSVDPATTTNCGNCVDPPGFRGPAWATSSNNDHIVLNQSAFIAKPPLRTWFAQIDGSNIGFLNSDIEAFDFWQPMRGIAAATQTGSTITYPSGFFSWVGLGGVKQSCTYAGGSITLAGTGLFLTYIDPATCLLDAQLQSGATATSSNITVSTVANPAYPTYTYAPGGGLSSYAGLNVLTMGTGSVTSGAISYYYDEYGNSPQDSESGQGLAVGAGPGPIMVVNNYISGGGVVGTFLTDGITNGTSPCGYINPCAVQYNIADLTEQRNTITTGPTKDYRSPSWNGGNYYWRNLSEVKQGKRVKQDGNIYGPIWAEVAEGECVSHGTYSGGYANSLGPAGIINYTDSSEWTFTNNTCLQTGAGIFQGFSYNNAGLPLPFHNAYIHNNLFNQVYGYQNSFPSPLGGGYLQTQNSVACAGGRLLQWGQNGENLIVDHNTVWEMGGCEPWFWDQYGTLSSGMTMTNNVLAFSSDLAGPYGGSSAAGALFQSYSVLGGGHDAPDCGGFQGSAFFACLTDFSWGGNVILGFWTDSFPGSLVEMTSSQIASAQATLPASYWPNANTLAGRLSQVSWFNPTTFNFRLNSASPYISGAHASLDGTDIGVDMDALEAAQGKVSNVRAYATTSTSTTVGFLAPDSFGCTVDWGTSNFTTGVGSFTRVANAGGQRVQNVALTGVPAHSLVYYRVNCAVQQPQGSVQLP